MRLPRRSVHHLRNADGALDRVPLLRARRHSGPPVSGGQKEDGPLSRDRPQRAPDQARQSRRPRARARLPAKAGGGSVIPMEAKPGAGPPARRRGPLRRDSQGLRDRARPVREPHPRRGAGACTGAKPIDRRRAVRRGVGGRSHLLRVALLRRPRPRRGHRVPAPAQRDARNGPHGHCLGHAAPAPVPRRDQALRRGGDAADDHGPRRRGAVRGVLDARVRRAAIGEGVEDGAHAHRRARWAVRTRALHRRASRAGAQSNRGEEADRVAHGGAEPDAAAGPDGRTRSKRQGRQSRARQGGEGAGQAGAEAQTRMTFDLSAPATELAAALRRKEFSSLELTQAYIDRIEKVNPKLNAYVLTTPELALSQARAADDGHGGTLKGVPVSIKDLISVAGYPMTLGSKAFENMVMPVDFFPVARLKEEGCPILGKTNTSEFGSRPTTEWGLFGATHNPWNVEHTPGGSSGGAAAAVAAGLCGFAQGSDGGGSVRIPASCCGVVGLKPARGRISPGPFLGEGWAGLATDGVLARTVRDAAAGLDAMAGHLPGDPYWAEADGSFREQARPPGKPLRVAFTGAASAPLDADVRSVLEAAARQSERLGHQVEEGGPDTGELRAAMLVIVTDGIASLPVADPSLLDPINAQAFEAARQITGTQYVQAVDLIRRVSRQVVAFWDEHDVLLTPTLTQPAPRLGTLGAEPATAHDEYLDWLSFTYPYNCTGQPALSLPLGMTPGGLPVGVQLVGPPRGEAVILQLAAQLEEAMPWRDRRPPGV